MIEHPSEAHTSRLSATQTDAALADELLDQRRAREAATDRLDAARKRPQIFIQAGRVQDLAELDLIARSTEGDLVADRLAGQDILTLIERHVAAT